jgi:hypothetical protein
MASTERKIPGKRSDLVEVDLTDEIVIYDQKTGDAHALNGAAANVWRLLAPKTTIETLSRQVAQRSEVDGRATVRLALRQFAALGLLEEKMPAAVRGGVSRRAMLQQLAFAGVAIPAIQSVRPQGIAQAVSAMGCADLSDPCFGVCPGNRCCVCTLTTEGSSVCIIPECVPSPPTPCTTSAGCPPGSVCVSGSNIQCCGTGASFCVRLCTPTTTDGVICTPPQGGGGTTQSKKGNAASTWKRH